MKVLFLPEVRTYFRELSEILFQKDYFGFEEYAINYVRELIFDIESSLPRKLSKPAPHISTATARICAILFSRKTRQPNGMCFSQNTPKITNLYI